MALLATLALPCCTDHASSEKARALEIEIEQLTKLNSDAEQASHRLQNQVEAARLEKDRLKEQKAKVEEDRDAATKELNELKKQFESYKSHYKLSMKQRSPGMHLDDFEVNGMTYRNVTVKELNDACLNFSHDSGFAKLSVSALPEALQDFLGINIPLPDPAAGRQAMITDPKLINASRLNEHEVVLMKTQDDRTHLVRQLADARHELYLTKQKIDYPPANAPVAALKRHLQDLGATIAKLEGQVAAAEIAEYQARRDTPQLVPRH